jgi:signal transduction histidine kinase
MRHWMQRMMQQSAGHDFALWPVLLLLLIVLVPSAGILWMMRTAMDSERLAARQRLAEAYAAQLEIARRDVDAVWKETLDRVTRIADTKPPAAAFAEIVCLPGIDSVVIYDAEGNVAYPPATSSSPTHDNTSGEWRAAERLEYGSDKPAEAAKAFAAIAANTDDALLAARARQAQARALASAGKTAEAIAVLEQLRRDGTVTDPHGRSLAADAELRLLDLLKHDSPDWQSVAASLVKRVNDYTLPLPADQRRFLMTALQEISTSFQMPTLDAEQLAVDYLATTPTKSEQNVVAASKLPEVSQLRSADGRVTALIQKTSQKRIIEQTLKRQPLPEGVATQVLPSDAASPSSELSATSLAPTLPLWRLSLSLNGPQSLDAAADKRMAYLLVTAVIVVALTAALALLVANVLRRQSQLTRLKNDLVATVSHELKTPLASIRLLVDTLLDADSPPTAPFGDHVRAREYLEMISKENSRLTRLIDNFLTFSRMERGKHRFSFQSADAATIVEQAVAAIADRFDGETNTLTARVEHPLPIDGDADALVTVVVNLLDNAWKYSTEPKHVAVTARRTDDQIEIAVTDNGLGLAPWDARRVFDRFYQVDQHLSRSTSGCGLGLSIVKYIVEAHNGTVAVESRLGTGSTFTVTLPAMSIPDNITSNHVDLTQRREGAKI